MQIPILRDAPVVSACARNFRDIFANSSQYTHFKDYLTGLIGLDNKSFASISTCVVDSSDATNLGRFFGNRDWDGKLVNQDRIRSMREQTRKFRRGAKRSALIIDDTMCEHVGNLFEFIDNHYDHTTSGYIWAHNPVTSHYVSGRVRFPLDFRLYRRYEEFTDWESFVHRYFPDVEIPRKKKVRDNFKKQVEQTLLQDPLFRARHEEFKTKITFAKELVKMAIELNLPFSLVLFDGWYLAPELLQLLASLHLDWISLLKKNRKVLTRSLTIYDRDGELIQFENKEIKIEDLLPLIPKSAFHPRKINGTVYWGFSTTAVIPSIGKVRLVISFGNSELEGTCCILVTNRIDWEAKRILTGYLERWPIETFYQDSKQYLGLGDYQMRKMIAIQNHWYLVFLSYSLLHLDILNSSLKKGENRLQTIGEACRHQSQALGKSLVLWVHRQLSKGSRVESIMDTLYPKSSKLCVA